MVGERIAIIVGMGAVTYLLRVFPLILGSRLTLSPRLIRWFQYLSYSIISSFIWFSVAKGAATFSNVSSRGLALALVILVAVRAKNAILGMGAGIGAVLLLSRLLP
jgi:branched-subunit amino acid transport protein